MSHHEFSIGDAINKYLKERGLKDTADIHRIIREWPKLMGKAIAENTSQIWFKEGVFFVQMDSPIWKNELSMAKSKIREVVNRELDRDLVQEVKVL